MPMQSINLYSWAMDQAFALTAATTTVVATSGLTLTSLDTFNTSVLLPL
jgi:hypothetical protein